MSYIILAFRIPTASTGVPMTAKTLIASFEIMDHDREVRVALKDQAAEMADRFNRELGSTDGELMAAAWSLFSAALEHALAGGTIQFVGGRADGLEVPVIEIVKNFVVQRRRSGEIRSS